MASLPPDSCDFPLSEIAPLTIAPRATSPAMLPFHFNTVSLLILIWFCDLHMERIRKFFKIVEVFVDTFRPLSG